jgi:hypothetical protein
MTNRDYQCIEESLLRVISLLSVVFTDSERNEVQEFIDVGEYGLALETLVDIVLEENKQIPGKVLMLVDELADVMKLDKAVFEEKLRGHVIDT